MTVAQLMCVGVRGGGGGGGGVCRGWGDTAVTVAQLIVCVCVWGGVTLQ